MTKFCRTVSKFCSQSVRDYYHDVINCELWYIDPSETLIRQIESDITDTGLIEVLIYNTYISSRHECQTSYVIVLSVWSNLT